MFKQLDCNGLVLAGVMVACASVALAQEPPTTTSDQSTNERRTVGTVTSAGRRSLTVRSDEGAFSIFVVEPSVIGKTPLEVGSRVRVITLVTDKEPAPQALAIDRLPPRQGLAPEPDDPPPLEIRQIEAQIQKQVKKYGAGLQGGVAIDPELFSLSGFATLAPGFHRNLSFRPGLELAFGEVTTMFGMNLDVLYALSGPSSGRWAPYFGLGPSFSLSHRGLDENEFISGDDNDVPDVDTDGDGDIDDDDDNDSSRFDFSQYDWNNGFNFIVGVRNPKGLSLEMKATAWGLSSIRMLVGYQF